MKRLLKQVGFIAAVFIFALLLDQITPLKQLDAYLKERPQPWLGLTIGALVTGGGLLLFTWISWGTLTGRRISEEEAKGFMHTSAGEPALNRVFRGKVAEVKMPGGEASFRQVKDAFRTGAWLRDPYIRVFCLGTIGVLLVTLGGFGYFVVIAPPTVKVICAGALLYAFGRTAWGFWKA